MTWTTIASIAGFLGVALGAFGAHGLESIATPEQLEWWRTATLYHLLHVAPLLALDPLRARERRVGGAGRAMLLGMLLFSGSLYAMGLGGPRWLGAVTPFGGVGFLVGWVLLGLAARAPRDHSSAGRASRPQ